MKKMSAGKFKARCLRVVNEVKNTRESVFITKAGMPIAKLVPVPTGKSRLLGRLEGRVHITGDIESPIW
jgi:prevent-host-death family protein